MSDAAIRLTAFFTIFAVMAVVEAWRPRRERNFTRPRRWTTNWAITILNSVVGRLMVFVAPFEAALWAANNGFGLFNLIELPSWFAILLSVVLLDLAIYAQHVIFHKVPMLWRLHRVHHSDLAFDVTTGVRFHPVEILLSLLIKAGLVVALGAPAVAVVLFEIVQYSSSTM